MGPLAGIKILEFAGIGPGPFCGMMLADMGADIIRIERVAHGTPTQDIMVRGRRLLQLDLKSTEAIDIVKQLLLHSDGLIEGFRPGVMERLGLGPDICLAQNPKLVFGRMTGWGQQGPLAETAGHDINYIALAGTLNSIGRAGDKPLAPLNLIGDFGGGGMLLAFGMVCGLLESKTSGQGQVIDAAMIDGAATLMAMFHAVSHRRGFNGPRGTNMLDSGAHFYDTYETADGKFIAIGSIEPQFYQLLKEKVGLSENEFGEQMNPEKWPQQKQQLAIIFKQKTQQQWCEILEYSDACFTPVLDFEAAKNHPHNQYRQTFIDIADQNQPAPAPRFSRTEADTPTAPTWITAEEAIASWR